MNSSTQENQAEEFKGLSASFGRCASRAHSICRVGSEAPLKTVFRSRNWAFAGAWFRKLRRPILLLLMTFTGLASRSRRVQ